MSPVNEYRITLYMTPKRRQLLERALKKSGKSASETVEIALAEYLARAEVEREAQARQKGAK